MNTNDLPYPRSCAVEDLGDAPDLLVMNDGSPVTDAASWARRRAEVADAIICAEYGGMPPRLDPSATTAELVSKSDAWRRSGVEGSAIRLYHVTVSGGAEPVRFSITLWLPKIEEGKTVPVILNGDGCWAYSTDAVIGAILGRGFALAVFNRCEVARDDQPLGRDSSDYRERDIYKAFPGGYGALSAWAWTYHRAYDALIQVPEIDPSRVAITGHSRGGKTVELAAATDERIAACGDNNSGCCGFSSFRVVGQGCERIADITRWFPYWFAEDFGKWAGHEAELPFDQSFLSALIAPRPLLLAVAHGDFWSNPPGACQTYREALPVYEMLGTKDNFGIVFRDGAHGHELGDWIRFADFLKERF